MTLDACLPESLRASASFTRLTRGLSSAAVYRVDVGEQRFVLKVADEAVPLEAWSRRLTLQRLAADAGLAPRVVHADAAQRSVLTEYVGDRGFMAQLSMPRTRDAALMQLGQVMRRVHSLPVPPGYVWEDPRESFLAVWARLADYALPRFVRDAIASAHAEVAPSDDLVLSHNDPNPSNLVIAGERLLVLDWDGAGPNDPHFDLAALSLFFRLDDTSTSRLIAAHDDAPVTELPMRFRQLRRLVAAECAIMAFDAVRRLGHPGGEVPLEQVPTLEAFTASQRAGGVSLATPEGLWVFSLALSRAAV